jgi:hypothetical protein
MPKLPERSTAPVRKAPISTNEPYEVVETDIDGKTYKVLKFRPAPRAAMNISKALWGGPKRRGKHTFAKRMPFD